MASRTLILFIAILGVLVGCGGGGGGGVADPGDSRFDAPFGSTAAASAYTATLTDPSPTRFEDVTLWVTGAPATAFTVTVDFPSDPLTLSSATDSDGNGSVDFNIGNAPLGVRIPVIVRFDDGERSSTAFTVIVPVSIWTDPEPIGNVTIVEVTGPPHHAYTIRVEIAPDHPPAEVTGTTDADGFDEVTIDISQAELYRDVPVTVSFGDGMEAGTSFARQPADDPPDPDPIPDPDPWVSSR